MDEPLSNLDAKLRVSMRSEIVDLHNKINATTIYVTHDQTEAMTMADRIVVMNKGYIQQIGTPKEIYNHPKNKFVATFVGSPSMNLLPVRYSDKKLILENGYEISVEKDYQNLLEEFYKNEIEQDEKWILENSDTQNPILVKPLIEEKQKMIARLKEALEKKDNDLILGIRPEGIKAYKEKRDDLLERKVIVSELLGSEYYLHFRLDDKTKLVAKASADGSYSINELVYLEFMKDKLCIFDPITEKNIE